MASATSSPRVTESKNAHALHCLTDSAIPAWLSNTDESGLEAFTSPRTITTEACGGMVKPDRVGSWLA